MNAVSKFVHEWIAEVFGLWDRFWFKPTLPHTLALIRICGGLMLLYTHLVWTVNSDAFFGPNSWVDNRTSQQWNLVLDENIQPRQYTWSYFWYLESPVLLWTVHIAALVVFLLLVLGLWSRVTSVLACVFTLAYCHRQMGATFGLDQMNAYIALYLTLGPCGDVWSLDRWLAERNSPKPLPLPAPSTGANLAIRLMQLHLCIVYLFGGLGKMKGETWWDGSAAWWAFASLEYQSLDMTWLVRHRWLLALMSHLTIFWETFYCCLIWPKLTRPLFLAMAIAVHGGIALALGMPTFGLIMIIANMAFLEPEWLISLEMWVREAIARPRLKVKAA